MTNIADEWNCVCGTSNKSGARFCRKCGKPHPLPSAPPETPASPAPQFFPVKSQPTSPAASVVPGVGKEPSDPQSAQNESTFSRTNQDDSHSLNFDYSDPAPAIPTFGSGPKPSSLSPASTGSGFTLKLILLGSATLVLVVIVGVLFTRNRPSHQSSTTSATASLSVPSTPQPINANSTILTAMPEWYLKGGMISGGFVPLQAQADWPEWMQALVGSRPNVSSQELAKTDLYKVPDVFLAGAITKLASQKIFLPALLRQATAITYTADTLTWKKARTDYQKAYLSSNTLPRDDPQTCSRLLTQMIQQKEYSTARSAIQASNFPPDATQKASFLRLIEMEEGTRKPTADIINDRSLPAAERLWALMTIKRLGSEATALESFQNTDMFAAAVFHGVTKGWIPVGSDLVDKAIQGTQTTSDASKPWLLIQDSERISDLLWLRAVDSLSQGQSDIASGYASSLVQKFPDSWYTGHAVFMLSGLGKQSDLASGRLKVPGDITLFTSQPESAKVKPVDRSWEASVQPLVDKGRYDLILAQADPVTQSEIFLKAAHMAGQEDLVSRYLATERKCTSDNLAYLYPLSLKATIEKAIQEEGLQGQVEASFVLAVIKNESLFQPSATSNSDAFGFMQLLKPTFTKMMGSQSDIRDPMTNIHGGLRYFKQVIKTAGLEAAPKDVRYAYILAGYHAGEGRAKTWRAAEEAMLSNGTGPLQTIQRVESIPIFSTRQYIARAMGDYVIFNKLMASN